jgi:hypothetical protein
MRDPPLHASPLIDSIGLGWVALMMKRRSMPLWIGRASRARFASRALIETAKAYLASFRPTRKSDRTRARAWFGPFA